MDYHQFISVLGASTFALLAITNPFGNLPVFIGMTENLPDEVRVKLFSKIILTAAVIMIVFALIGTFVMEKFFKVDLASLRIAGGILLMVMGSKNLLFPPEAKKVNNENQPSAPIRQIDVDSVIKSMIIPMAFPMMVGPGALSTIIIIKHETGLLISLLSIFVSFAAIFVLFRRYKLIEQLLGKLTLFVLSRIMQVFIMAIGAKMLVAGILESIPILKG